MSCESDLDNELSRLRNELLLGLGKRIVAKSAQQQQDREKTDETSIRAEKEEANGRDDEGQDDLEQLRSEALNAKRAKEQKYERPGRFRYDIERKSDHEDDDYYDELLITHNDSDHDDDEPTEEAARHVKTTTNGVEEAAMSAEQHSTNNCHRTNYEAYRLECSRHMAAHEIYEPSSESVVDDLHRMRSRVLEQNSHDDDDDDDDCDDTNRTKRLKSVVVVKVNYTNSSTWKETTHSHRHRHDHTSGCRYDQHSSSSGSTSSSRRRRKYSNMSPYSNR